MNKKVRKTIIISDTLFYNLKVYAVRHRIPYSHIIEDLLKKFLEIKDNENVPEIRTTDNGNAKT